MPPAPPVPFDVPVGTIIAFAGDPTPEILQHWLECDGAPIDSNDARYTALCNVLKHKYDPPSQAQPARSIHYVPDIRGRALVGAGTGVSWNPGPPVSNSPLSPRSLGSALGVEAQRIPNHAHEVSKHNHVWKSFNRGNGGLASAPGTAASFDSTGGDIALFNDKKDLYTSLGGGSDTTGLKNAENGGMINNLQPSLVIRYLIRYR
jgi:hypothetical protein